MNIYTHFAICLLILPIVSCSIYTIKGRGQFVNYFMFLNFELQLDKLFSYPSLKEIHSCFFPICVHACFLHLDLWSMLKSFWWKIWIVDTIFQVNSVFQYYFDKIYIFLWYLKDVFLNVLSIYIYISIYLWTSVFCWSAYFCSNKARFELQKCQHILVSSKCPFSAPLLFV